MKKLATALGLKFIFQPAIQSSKQQAQPCLFCDLSHRHASPHLPTAVTTIAFVTARGRALEIAELVSVGTNQMPSKQNAQHVP
ncbi:hypothetical protein HDF15_002428 [Granulicella mallensis]|uniref:Uncharacterized protein n=1 Tax=Granulicella mallensis TaxID=940614 RepID=A0A7W7ZQV7_9BACT|nr:hypothetical protein [Granulicella mallensis]